MNEAETRAGNFASLIRRHGRACPGHPRLASSGAKTWMPGTRPGMTGVGVIRYQNPRHSTSRCCASDPISSATGACIGQARSFQDRDIRTAVRHRGRMNEPETRAELAPLPLAGEGAARRRRAAGEGNSGKNALKHAFAILRHIAVPEPKHTPALGSEEGIAPAVACAFRVLAAVELDHEPVLDRGEVGDVRTDRHLSPKLHAVKSSVAQQIPHRPFRLRRITTQLSGKVSLLAFTHTLTRPRFARPPSPASGRGKDYHCRGAG